MLLAVDLYEDLIDEEGIAVTPVLAFQSAGINGTKFYTPETDLFPGDNDAALGE